MTNKLELKSSHEVIYTVDVADVESIFYCKPTDPDILTVLMKDGKRLYCDEVCPLQEEPVSEGKDIFDNCLKSEEKFILPQKISGNINCENCSDSSACALGDIQACIIDKPVSEDLEEAANNHAAERYRVTRDRELAEKCKWSFKAGSEWKTNHLWKDAQGDDLPEIDREVIALLNNGKVVYAHRPYKGKYIGKNLTTGNIETFENKVYDKGGWNQPDVKYWLDCFFPNIEED